MRWPTINGDSDGILRTSCQTRDAILHLDHVEQLHRSDLANAGQGHAPLCLLTFPFPPRHLNIGAGILQAPCRHTRRSTGQDNALLLCLGDARETLLVQ